MLILLKKFHLKIRVFYFKDVKLITEKFNYKPNSMKKIVLPIVLFLSVCSYSQFITVNEGYTTRELIEDILINDICTTASNFGSRTGSDYGQGNGIGAFSANGSDFPYQNGIILSSGFVSNAPGPNSNATLEDGDPSWPGDVDLDAYTNVSESLNASFIQFDFVPSISSISFNFIFASEEYNQVFECVYSDAFAFILTDQATGIVRNLAVLPGSETPIECTNVHPLVLGLGGCAAINEIFFDKYNFDPFNNSNFSATAFNGQMTSLSAQGNVIPGNLYTIKLVVGDDGNGIDDTIYDSAVFLEAGSFNSALDPGTDGVLTICEGEVVTSAELFSSLGGSPDGGGLWSPLPLAGAGTYTYTHLAVGLCPGVSAVVEVDAQTAPPIFPPPVLEYCDPDNDGFGSFTLTDADTYVLGGNTTVTLEVSYHYTPDDAQNGVNKIEDSPYFNDVQNTQLVYVRLYDTSSGCYSTTTLELSVLSSPQITHPDDLFPLVQCDDAIFDLTQSEQFIITPHTDYVFTYYSDVALQILIPSPTAYTSILPNPQTIYIVVGYPPTGGVNNDCTSQTSLNLIVNTPPLLSPPDPYKLCDGTGLLGSAEEAFFDLESQSEYITGDPSVLITYHETQDLANSGTNALESPYTNTSNPQTIFIRAVSEDTQCVVTQGITLDLVVNPLPSPLTPTALEVCDIDNDGFASFTLTDKNIEIIGGEPGVLLTYHETLLDAQVGNYALTSPYINIVTPSQIIYVRAVYPLPPLGTGTGCFETVQLELIVNPTPIIPFNIEDLVVCDDDRDGVSIFDLTDKEDIIYGTQSPADFTLTYYLTQEHATNGTPRIANPTVFENTINPQTIWVRLEHNFTECFKIGKFNIFSQSGPSVVQPLEPLTECDDLGDPNDGVTLFDLTLMNDVITDGVSGVTVEYYTDPDLYFSIMNPTAYENLTNPQNIYTRVTNVNTSCFNTSIYLTLRVAANPDPEDPDPIILCDVNNPGDMKEVFDLTNREVQILDGETWNLSYYNSYQDAIDNNDMIAIPTIYTNVTSPEIVYVRVSIDISDVTACFEIVELELIVNPLPDATAVISPYIICEVPSDGEAVFDLSTKIGEILNGQDPFIFEVLFYENQDDADLMINAIQNPTTYSNLVNPQTIYVVILNGTTACFVATQSFDIEEQEGAVANPPDPHAICDNLDENDGIAEFDLLNQDLLDEILGAQDSSVYQLDFYGTLDNATLGVSPLPVTYINIINPQIIYARVTNTNTVCYDITQVILKVELIPELVLDDVYTLCVDALGNSIPEVAGNISLPVIDTGLNPSIYMFEWQLNSEVLWGEIGASITVLQEGTYMVIVTEILTGCMSSATTTVVTSSPPLNYSVEVTDAFASEHTITATANGIGDYEFQLDGNPFQGSGVFLDVAPGNHLVTIKDVNGCGSVTITVIVIDYPQFMTPNQDGYHDTWNIIGISDGDPTAKIYIFDRHGKLLKQLSTFSEGWDGSYNGNPMPSNDYWFRVEYTENNTKKEFSGHFTLKR